MERAASKTRCPAFSRRIRIAGVTTNQLVASAARVLAAMRAELPDIRCRAAIEGVAGYGNDRWVLDTDAGKLLAKVGRFPFEPTQVDRQARAQRWLAEIGFPTPELIHLAGECAKLDGRRFSVQRYVESEPDDLVQVMDAGEFETFFADLGAAVGLLHRIELPHFDGWIDYRGRPGDSWQEIVPPTDALRAIHDHGATVPSEVLAEAERRIDAGIAALPKLEPRLVHRDLHLGNTLLVDGRFAALIDFELVKEWDFAYDFNRIQGMFEFYGQFGECRRPLLDHYQAVAGELPASFPLRHWLYQGIAAVLGVEALIDGNDGYVDRPASLVSWLDLPAPS